MGGTRKSCVSWYWSYLTTGRTLMCFWSHWTRKLFLFRSCNALHRCKYHSIEWTQFRNHSNIDYISLQTFSTNFKLRLPFLRHLRLITVDVVDHLGCMIPVPIQFCSTWNVRCAYSRTPYSQITHSRNLGFWLYHKRLLQWSCWESHHHEGWLSSHTRCRQSSDLSVRFQLRGKARNDSRNEHYFTTEWCLSWHCESVSPMWLRQCPR